MYSFRLSRCLTRDALAMSLALSALTTAPQPARASGGPRIGAFAFVGVGLAQIVEGVVVAVIATWRLGRDGGIPLLFFALGCVAIWWFLLSSVGLDFVERVPRVWTCRPILPAP